jgi:hypothetical protein
MAWTPLHFSSSLCNFDVCCLLLQRGADPQAEGAEYYPPRFSVARVQAAASCRVPPCSQQTPLHLAAANGHIEICRALIESKADVAAISRCKGGGAINRGHVPPRLSYLLRFYSLPALQLMPHCPGAGRRKRQRQSREIPARNGGAGVTRALPLSALLPASCKAPQGDRVVMHRGIAEADGHIRAIASGGYCL